MKKIIQFLVFATFLFPKNIVGQHFYTRNYTINDGLPDNTINTIYKDSKGFLWIGTNVGAAKFDGNIFDIKSTIDGLAGNKVIAITEDKNGNLWFGCNNAGISSYNGVVVHSYTKKDGLISNKITTLKYFEKFNLLCIGTENGLSVYNGEEFLSFSKKSIIPNQRFYITSFLATNQSIYVFTDDQGVYQLNINKKELKYLPATHPLFFSSVSASHITKKKDTLIGINHVGFKGVGKKNVFINDTLGNIVDFIEDDNNNIWIAVNNQFKNTGGLYKYKNHKLTYYNKCLNIKTQNISALTYDKKERILWIGTENNGLYMYPKNNFLYYQPNDFEINNFPVNNLLIDNYNHIWFATSQNVVEIFPDQTYKTYPLSLFEKEFHQFTKNEMKIKYYFLKDPTGSYEKYERLIKKGKYSYPNPYLTHKNDQEIIIPATSLYKPLKYDVLINKKLNNLNTIKKDQSGNIWIGSNVGLFKILRNKQTVKYYDLEAIDVSNFVFGPNNELIVTSWNNVFIYPHIEKNFKRKVYNYFEDVTPVNIKRIKTHNNKIWLISRDNGIFLYDKGIFKSFYNPSQEVNSFNDICFDQKGNIILGDENGIIYITVLKNDSIVNQFYISKKNNLLGTSIRWLNCTEDNFLIAGTNSGVNIIDLNQLYQKGKISLKKVVHSQGFKDYTGEISFIHDGNIWIGTHNYLIKGNIQDLLISTGNDFNFYLKSIKVTNNISNELKDSIIHPQTLTHKQELVFPAHKNSITFDYDIIQFVDYENIKFSYILEGLSEEWSGITKEHRAAFQNLKPGNYLFRVKAINTTNLNSTKELSVNFKIKPPFWANWWFYASATIFSVFLIWLVIFLRTKKIKKRERNLAEISEKITEFEMKALRAQMNPHFIFNAINSIQNYMLDNDIDAALGYLSDFAKLIRITLDNVVKKKVTLEEELNYLKFYLNLEKMRFDKHFDIEIILPKEFEQRKIEIPPMVIQPFVENAIKHGFIYKKEDAKLKLEFKIINDDILHCIIEDNGIGRQKSRELNRSNHKSHQSMGSFITHERLMLLNNSQPRKGYKINTIDLYDEYNLPCGTRVEITIPI
ncbi:MAG TPA: two-component regulator propeller domain-containing protein [Bacteroidales bacterium]|nr:two-component regulator propeller domain-containing protein [Bacteroidales bacterium]